jgi:D-serine deaminase-like pyridoxal phosphate-dependent protein
LVSPALRDLAGLPEPVRLTVALDSPRAVDDIAAAAREAGRQLVSTWSSTLECIASAFPRVDDALALARTVREHSPLEFAGSRSIPATSASPSTVRRRASRHSAAAIAHAVETFDRAGCRPPVVSGGSTPTLWRTHELPGVTEFRPVLTSTTIGRRRRSARAHGTIAHSPFSPRSSAPPYPGKPWSTRGSKALGREPMRGTDAADGFGALLDRPDVVVKSMSEEHGILDLSKTDWKPVVGDRVRSFRTTSASSSI